MSDERLERIEKRLDEIAELLKELVEMARRDWEIYQAALNAAPALSYEQTAKAKNRFRGSLMKSAVEGSQAYVQGSNAYTDYLKERFGPAPDLGDVWSIHAMDEEEKAEVKKGEIRPDEVPQKLKTARGKSRKRTGAPDYD